MEQFKLDIETTYTALNLTWSIKKNMLIIYIYIYINRTSE